ncbi:sugar ABC transporter permease [Paenibacillus taichungensis]|jgi:putative aldouronate transport system permease protein|uniref:Sugar ABC transporter permease n=2 Tax=Paenibacillus TaxID=44249 RepID=A0A329R1B3_9BACL|nr:MULTISPECIES: ABC transporter permease subunit [Paenibacillus]RAW18434.1 sugar ABC transporter permease [Paenibacillus taichungensis]SDK60686.1 carbohydrate ABC transporter membrane protein 1, CUT1 family [Paenibacillus sp. OK060]SEA78275.1 putative aldouronate transport system permease protein [Paenibacillus sp. 276b]SLJ90010.1 carbohydrate ABC transporter membrane protein 1, CUT1 family [Paenibacillus sp. RU5A]SOC59100.1 carbohydrate ABC transporter membrane protein 1, CUT1 family [Paenib
MESETAKTTLTMTSLRKESRLRTVTALLRKDWQLYSLLILPIIYLIIFKYGPMLGNVIAFRRFVPGGSIFGETWVGFRYFQMFIQDPTFWKVFGNTLMLGGLALLFTFPVPIIFALLLNEVKSKRFKKFVQTASYLPHFLSIVIVAGMILQLTAVNGSINGMVSFFTGDSIPFMQRAEWFRTIYITSEVWQGMGWGAILYLAALTTIDDSLYEAARIDGANRWKQTLHITIPGILPTIVTLLILNMGNFLAVGFEKILLLYNPLIYETSDVISTYLYRVGLQSSNFSYATAIGLFESIIGLILVFSVNAISRRLTQRSLW